MNDNGSFINDYRVSRDTDKIKDCDVPCPEKQQEELLRMVNESRKY